MTKARDMAALFRAVSVSDWSSARSAAHRIADAEDKAGHHAAALMLRGSLNGNGSVSATAGAASLVGLEGAIAPVSADVDLKEVRLRASARREIELVAQEWEQQATLAKHGVPRRSRLLFHGPPGCGKSMTARALAARLELPAFVVRFDAIVGAYLGQTAVRLRQVFQFAEQLPCVLVFDEIDAIAKRRGSAMDVGELDRVVISLLQELEHSVPSGILVASSNVAPQLDEAVWRRFDLALQFPAPSKAAVQAFATERAKKRRLVLTRSMRTQVQGLRSFAAVDRFINDALRRGILAESGKR